MWDILPVAMSVIGSVMGAQGNYQAGDAARAAGVAQQQAYAFQAAQLEQNAGQAVAASQRAALNEQLTGEMAISRTVALAAASGGGTGGSVIDLIGRMSGRTSYDMSTALYNGEERARQMRMQAAADTTSGDFALASASAKQTAYQTAAVGSLFKGGASLFTNYARGGFGVTGSSPSGASISDAGITPIEIG